MTKILFKSLRLLMMPFMLLWANLAKPKGMVRKTEDQLAVDLECAKLKLYHFNTCPFCIKVRHEMSRLSLPIQLFDAQHDPVHRADLLEGGGKIQTPCLRIVEEQDGVRWMYESKDIIIYLQQRFAVQLP